LALKPQKGDDCVQMVVSGANVICSPPVFVCKFTLDKLFKRFIIYTGNQRSEIMDTEIEELEQRIDAMIPNPF
jgi:hypothetical protein